MSKLDRILQLEKELSELKKEEMENSLYKLKGVVVIGYKIRLREIKGKMYLYAKKGKKDVYLGRETSLLKIENIIKEKTHG